MEKLSTDVGGVDLADYGARLRRRWWAVVGGMVLGLLAGWGFMAIQTPQYVSTTSVLVLPTPDGAAITVAGRTNREINLDTEAQLVQSAQVATTVQDLLGSQPTPAVLRSNVAVTVPPNSQVLTIEFTATTPEGAQAGAAAYAQAYLDQRRDVAEADIAGSVEVLTAQLAALREQLNEASVSAAGLDQGSSDRALVEVQRNILVSQISDVSNRLSPLQATTVAAGRVITEATLPSDPSSPVLALNLGAGLMAGLLLGLAVAMVADRADHRIRRIGDISRHSHLPILADIRLSPSAAMVIGGEHAATFDLLRNSVIGSNPSLRVLQVAGLGGDTATEVTAVQLARSLARASHEVTLVIADPASSLAERTRSSGATGLVDVIRGQVRMDSVAIELPELPGISVVPSGREPEALESLLQSAGLPRALSAIRASGATVVVQSPAPDRSAAAQAVAGSSDTVILVAEQGVTDARRIAIATAEIQHMGTPVAGVVLIHCRRKRRSGNSSRSTAGPTPPPTSGSKSGASSTRQGSSSAAARTAVDQGATSR